MTSIIIDKTREKDFAGLVDDEPPGAVVWIKATIKTNDSQQTILTFERAEMGDESDIEDEEEEESDGEGEAQIPE